MMQKLSLAGSGWAVILLTTLLGAIGVPVMENDVGDFIESVLWFTGVLMAVYGQLRRKDLTFGILRRS